YWSGWAILISPHFALSLLRLCVASWFRARETGHEGPKQTRRHHKPSDHEEKSFLPRRANLHLRKASVYGDDERLPARRGILYRDSRSQYQRRSPPQGRLSVDLIQRVLPARNRAILQAV